MENESMETNLNGARVEAAIRSIEGAREMRPYEGPGDPWRLIDEACSTALADARRDYSDVAMPAAEDHQR